MNFEEELAALINKYGLENNSNTPDFILAQYLLQCMYCFNTATQSRDKWYGNERTPNLPEASTNPPTKSNSGEVKS